MTRDDVTAPTTPGLAGLRATAITVVAIGLLALWQSLQVPSGGGYSAVGPRVFPAITSVALIVLGVAFVVTTTIRPDASLVAKAAAERAASHWPTPVVLGAALLGYAFTLAPAGYVVSTAVFLPLASRVLGSTSLRRDAIVGAVAAVVLYVMFTAFLGVRLPAGVLSGLPVVG